MKNRGNPVVMTFKMMKTQEGEEGERKEEEEDEGEEGCDTPLLTKKWRRSSRGVEEKMELINEVFVTTLRLSDTGLTSSKQKRYEIESLEEVFPIRCRCGSYYIRTYLQTKTTTAAIYGDKIK